MQGVGLTTEQLVDVLSAYAVPQEEILAVAETPGWYVVGGFFMPTTAKVVLAVLGSVSDASLALHVRLFDLASGKPVSGATASIVATSDARATSGVFSLLGNRSYQFQAEIVGDAGEGLFGILRSATLVLP